MAISTEIDDELATALGAPSQVTAYQDALHKNYNQMRAALEEIRDKAATTPNGGAWAGGMAVLCLGTLSELKCSF